MVAIPFSSLLGILIIKPTFWITTTVLFQSIILLLLMIVYRTLKTLFIFWLPKDNWFKRRQFASVQSNQLILITGATSGIGFALAKHLYKLGYSVLATYYSTNEPGYEELKRLSANNGKRDNCMFLIELDVRKQESISEAYKQTETILQQFKQLNLFALINNAGLGSLQPFAWLQRSTIKALIETNLSGNLLMTREFLPLLINNNDRNDKRIIFVSSGLGLVPGPTYATYGVTKCSQIYLAKCLNLELKQVYGIQSVAVIPHNFIKITNICSQNVKNNQLAWDELKPLERKLYQKQFDEHNKLAESLEKATKVHREINNQTTASSSSTNKRQNQRSSSAQVAAAAAAAAMTAETFTQRATFFIRQACASLRGENWASTIEESGALEGFEMALRLKNPPELIFAGDTIFQLIVGSLFLLLPTSFSGLLSGSVAPNLYR